MEKMMLGKVQNFYDDLPPLAQNKQLSVESFVEKSCGENTSLSLPIFYPHVIVKYYLLEISWRKVHGGKHTFLDHFSSTCQYQKFG